MLLFKLGNECRASSCVRIVRFERFRIDFSRRSRFGIRRRRWLGLVGEFRWETSRISPVPSISSRRASRTSRRTSIMLSALKRSPTSPNPALKVFFIHFIVFECLNLILVLLWYSHCARNNAQFEYLVSFDCNFDEILNKGWCLRV